MCHDCAQKALGAAYDQEWERDQHCWSGVRDVRAEADEVAERSWVTSFDDSYLGRTLRVRSDRHVVQLYAGSELVKVHPRMPPGKRATDPNDYPQGKAPYATRSIDALLERAQKHGAQIGVFAERLLAGPLPWTRMRQAYGLLRLCERYGSDRVEALCARSLAFDVVDVPRIERMLKGAQRAEQHAVADGGRVVQLPQGRFARDAASFVTVAPKKGGE